MNSLMHILSGGSLPPSPTPGFISEVSSSYPQYSRMEYSFGKCLVNANFLLNVLLKTDCSGVWAQVNTLFSFFIIIILLGY